MDTRFQKTTKILKKKNKVVLINQNTGQWIRISDEVFDIINRMIERKYNLMDLEKYFYNCEDCDYIKNVMRSMFLSGILINERYNNSDRNKIAMIEITSKCNLNCIHCGWKLSKKYGDLNTTDMISVIDKVVKWNPMEIVLSGGEPLLREDIDILLKRIKERYSGCITLSSNGTLISETNIDLLSKYVNKFEISLDGFSEETCSIIRGNGVYKKVIENINLLQKYCCKNIYLSMVVGTGNNAMNIKKFNNLCKLINVKPLLREYMKINNKEIDGLFEHTDDNINKEYKIVMNKKEITACSCTAGKKDILIRSNGDVFPCQRFTTENYCMGNLTIDNNIDEIIANHKNIIKEQFKERLKKMGCEYCGVIDFCWTCPAEVIYYDSNINTVDVCNYMKKELNEGVWG